jgi:Flp pilus assembly protein TadB
MDTGVWIVIAAAAVLIIGLILWSARRARERKLEEQRNEARELRSQAEAKTQRAERRASVADKLADRARVERQAAQVAARRADEVDPDVD